VFSFPDGLETLPNKLALQLSIKYNVPDARIGDAPVTVIALPAHKASQIVAGVNSTLASLLMKVQYAPMVIAAVSLSDFSFNTPLQGFGFLVPRNQGLHLLGSLFTSALFPGRAPKGKELLTCFVGGTFEPEAIDWPDDQVWEVVCSEIKSALATSDVPRPVALFRQRQAIPQYNVGHQRWLAAVKDELRKTPGLFMTGNYLEGISVPGCIEQGDRTARAVAEYLGRKQ
jgi:oxygen-dependent protoporphyrinogen oxidase